MRTAVTSLAVLLAAAPSSAQEPAAPDVEAVAWLAGCWEASSSGGQDEEVWMAPGGGVMVGMARSIRGGSARGWEFLLLRRLDGVLTYSAHPSGQELTHFPATSVGPERVTFANPEHDFPQALEYLRVGSDSLVVRVYGEVQGADLEGLEPAFVVPYARRSGC